MTEAVPSLVPRAFASAGAPSRSGSARDGGFTLVELMVVLVVIALAAGAVTWALPDPRGRVADEAARFAARTQAARDEAIVTGIPTSVWVTAGGYGFETRVAGGWTAQGGPFALARWSDGTQVTLPGATGRARVIFDPTGMADRPLDVRLARRDAGTLVRIAGDGGVRVGA